MRERLRETWADPTQWHAGVASLRVLAAEAHIGRIAEPAALKRKLEWIARQREDFHILLIRAAHRAIDGCLRWAYVPRDTGLHARKSILIAAEALAAGTPLEAILTEFSIVDPYARTVLALVTDLGSAAYFLPTALRWDAIASKYTLDIAAYATDGPRLDALVAKVAMPSSRPPAYVPRSEFELCNAMTALRHKASLGVAFRFMIDDACPPDLLDRLRIDPSARHDLASRYPRLRTLRQQLRGVALHPCAQHPSELTPMARSARALIGPIRDVEGLTRALIKVSLCGPSLTARMLEATYAQLSDTRDAQYSESERRRARSMLIAKEAVQGLCAEFARITRELGLDNAQEVGILCTLISGGTQPDSRFAPRSPIPLADTA